jgi:hypothetical protein
MNARTKLRWVDIPRRSLREGLACGHGGVQVMLMIGDDSPSAVLSAAPASRRDTQPDAREPEKAR